MKYILRILFIIIAFVTTIWSAYAANQMRTVEVQIADSALAVSTAQNYPFTLYIGDDLSGVATPAVKSLIFTVSGVYTGGGTIAFSIDGVASTTKSFTLPSVGTPTPFEIDYSSPGTISPSSGGSYAYTLNYVPTSVTVYGLGIKMTETHRYKPPACADGQPANQKIKTTENAVADSALAVSTAQNYPFTLYIGDDLSGVATPAVKSLIFTVSGVYTGGGTIAFSIDGVASTTKSFTLPSVGTPTPFEIDYSSPGTISPSSGGSYAYTLNYVPTSVTVYGLGIKMTETHRYKPPACGGMPIYGDLVSAVFDSTGSVDGAGYNSILWKGVLGGPGANQGHVKFQFAMSDVSSGPWNYVGGATCAGTDWFDPGAPSTPIELNGSACLTAWNNKRYFRYKIRICSDDCIVAGTYTPVVDDVVVNWAP